MIDLDNEFDYSLSKKLLYSSIAKNLTYILFPFFVIDCPSSIPDWTGHDGNGLFPIHQWQLLLPSV